MQIIGTVAANAVVSTLPSGTQLVDFDIAMNEGYTDKDGKYVDRVQFIRCTVWNRPKMANMLTKGTGVNMSGRMSARGWTDKASGEVKAGLNFTAAHVEIVGKIVRDTPLNEEQSDAVPVPQTADDLTF